MNTLRTLTVVVVLAAVAYGVYASLNNKPIPDPPGLAQDDWNGAPTVELPGAPSAVQMPSAPSPVAPPAVEVAAAPVEMPVPVAPAAATAPLSDSAPPFTPAASTPPAPTAEVYTGGVASPPPTNAAMAPTTMPAGDAPSTPQDRYAAPPTSDDRYTAAPGVTPPASDDRYATPSPAPPGDDPSNYAAQTPLDAGPPTPSAPGTPAVTVSGTGSAEFDTALATAQAQLDQGQLAEAHLALSQWFGHPDLSAAQEAQLIGVLDQVAGTVVYSRQSLVVPAYQVQPGDTLEQIAQTNNVPWQLLAKINGIPDPQNLRAGDQLKVVRGPFAAVVELSKYRMSLWVEGRYAGRFPIGVGNLNNLPEGEFMVRGKVENPTYYGDQVIDADDPNNPLGERLIDLGNQIGIHGTNDPATIGSGETRGTIALGPRDVEDVYDILSIGSTVVIRR